MNSSAVEFGRGKTVFIFSCILGVPHQNGVSQACGIVEIQHFLSRTLVIMLA